MLDTDLSTRDCDGHVVVALGGELDLAADIAAALRPPSAAVAALPAAVLSHRVGAAGKCSDTADDRCYPALPDGRHPGELASYARALCLGCTVRDECLELALRYEALTRASHGVWGGTAPHERTEMLRETRWPRPATPFPAQTLSSAARNPEQQTGSAAYLRSNRSRPAAR